MNRKALAEKAHISHETARDLLSQIAELELNKGWCLRHPRYATEQPNRTRIVHSRATRCHSPPTTGTTSSRAGTRRLSRSTNAIGRPTPTDCARAWAMPWNPTPTLPTGNPTGLDSLVRIIHHTQRVRVRVRVVIDMVFAYKVGLNVRVGWLAVC